jgi:hypothetical protein
VNKPRHLILIPGEKGIEGPAKRLGLYDRFPQPDYWRLTLAILTKGVLLMVMWVVFKNLRAGN